VKFFQSGAETGLNNGRPGKGTRSVEKEKVLTRVPKCESRGPKERRVPFQSQKKKGNLKGGEKGEKKGKKHHFGINDTRGADDGREEGETVLMSARGKRGGEVRHPVIRGKKRGGEERFRGTRF